MSHAVTSSASALGHNTPGSPRRSRPPLLPPWRPDVRGPGGAYGALLCCVSEAAVKPSQPPPPSPDGGDSRIKGRNGNDLADHNDSQFLCQPYLRTPGIRGGDGSPRRHGLQHTWRAATESRVADRQSGTPIRSGVPPPSQAMALEDQFAWKGSKSSAAGCGGLPPHLNLSDNMGFSFFPQKPYSLTGTSRASTFGNRVQPGFNQQRRSNVCSNVRQRGALFKSPDPPGTMGGPLESSDPRISTGGARRRGDGGRQWQHNRNILLARKPNDPFQEPRGGARAESSAGVSRHDASGVRVVKANTTVMGEDASFFHTVSFGHSDQELFATSQVGCFYDGINRELERILLELSQKRREGKSVDKLLPRAIDESEESWKSRHIPLPKSVVLGPAHQFYCSLSGRASLRSSILQSQPQLDAAKVNQRLDDLAPGFDEEDRAFFRCNSGSTSLLEQIQRDPLAIEFLTFGFKPDSYFCLTADQIFHNRLPPDMVQTMESEPMDIESVQLWKGDGWFMKDSEDNIYFNNICDLTLLDILDHHHPFDPVEHFSISLNGLNWYVRTASGTEFYKSQMLRNIQQKYDAQFADSACLIRSAQVGN